MGNIAQKPLLARYKARQAYGHTIDRQPQPAQFIASPIIDPRLKPTLGNLLGSASHL